MSRTVYIDGRTVQLMDCHRIINAAIDELNARRSDSNCGHADVVKSDLDVSSAVQAFRESRYRDQMDDRDTNELQAKLDKDTPDYSAETLGDWRPDVSVPPVKVHENVREQEGGRRLIEMLDVPLLDDRTAGVEGVTISVLEVDDGSGGTSYEIGLDSILFDDKGEWKSNKSKAAWESFLARRAAEEGTQGDAAPAQRSGAKAEQAMRVAGLAKQGSRRVPGGRTQTVFGTNETVTKPAAKSFKVGE